MKKFYFLFAMLLSFVGVTSVFAQDEEPITVQMTKSNGEWTVCNSVKTWATQWTSYGEPAITVTNISNGGNNATVRGQAVKGNNNMAYINDGEGVEFFTGQAGTVTPQTYRFAVESSEYKLTGVSFSFTSSNADGTEVTLGDLDPVQSANTEDLQSLFVTDQTEGWVDMVVATLGSANNFAMATDIYITIQKLSAADAAFAQLKDVYAQYSAYRDAFPAGTAPGEYDEEAVKAFQAALDAADIDNPDINFSSLTADEMKALADDILSTYEALLASKVPMSLTDGYYRIRTGLEYSVTETVVDEETMEETTVTQIMPKYLRARQGTTNTGEKVYAAAWNTPEDLTTDCLSLWYIKNQDGNFDVMNMGTDMRFEEVSGRSGNFFLSTESQNLLAFDAVATVDGISYFNMRVASQPENSYYYIHQGGHSGGKGTGNWCVAWTSTYSETPGASEWYLEPISEEDAKAIMEAYAPIKDREQMLVSYDSIMTAAQKNLTMAKDVTAVGIITENSQFSSPWTEESEGSLDNLLDGDSKTYWHSAWSGGEVPNHTHYLQVALAEPIDQEVYLSITRRPVANDHVTKWGVWGSNDPEAADEAWVELDSLDTPFGNNTETIKTKLFDTKGNQYLRFYIDSTTTNRGYGHVSEFQLYYDLDNPAAQYHFMGDLYTNLENVVNELKDVETDEVTTEEYNKLKTAFDAFMTKFVDPTELRNKLEEVNGAADVVVTGNNPGYWKEGTDASAFKAVYDAAVAYDAKGDYTPEQSASYIEQLDAQAEAIFDSAIKVETGKWYRIRFATEEECEANGWALSIGEGTYNEDLGVYTTEPMFGKYVTASYHITEEYVDLEGNERSYTVVADDATAEVLGLGSSVLFDDKEDIQEEDLAMFRFVAVGDSAYIIQNKGTNLFLRAAGTSGAVTLSAQPSLFSAKAIGYGENLISAKSLTGDSQNNLHGQKSGNTLVTWSSNTAGTASGLFIEEVEAVAGDYEGAAFNVPVVYGAVNTFCFPVDITVEGEGQMWTVNSLEGTSVTLAKIEKADAGRPFIFVNGKTEDYDAEEDAEMAVMKHGFTFVTEPQTEGVMKGTFTQLTIGAGMIVAQASDYDMMDDGEDIKGNTLTVTKRSKAHIPANSAYITGESALPRTAEVTVVWDENAADGLATALANVTKSGAVYTIDGRLVSKKATLNDLQKFGKGMYILNGTKVIVK